MLDSPNSRTALEQRHAAGSLAWARVAVMLPARSVLAIVAGGLTAGLFALQHSPTPWRDAAAWFPLYAVLIDGGCLFLLWRFTRREQIRLVDLIGFDRSQLWRDVLFGLLLIPPSLVLILG